MNERRWLNKAELLGDLLEERLPARAFCTLTKPSGASRNQMEQALDQWLLQVQTLIGFNLGAIWSVERTPSHHVHAALVCASPFSIQDCVHAEAFWRSIVKAKNKDAAQVRLYLNGRCGMSYIIKELGSAIEDIQMSDHIAAYYPHSPFNHYGKNSAERRKILRIREEMEREAARDRE